MYYRDKIKELFKINLPIYIKHIKNLRNCRTHKSKSVHHLSNVPQKNVFYFQIENKVCLEIPGNFSYIDNYIDTGVLYYSAFLAVFLIISFPAY